MDTTKENIIMCHKAIEIQALWKPTGGDWFIHDYRNTTGSTREFEKQMWGDTDRVWQGIEILCYKPSDVQDIFVTSDGQNSHITSAKDIMKKENTWLPRQDQLQKIVDKQYFTIEWYNGVTLYLPFAATVCFDNPKHCKQFTSMEQLWLAFVMKEKYDKFWDGKDWKAT